MTHTRCVSLRKSFNAKRQSNAMLSTGIFAFFFSSKIRYLPVSVGGYFAFACVCECVRMSSSSTPYQFNTRLTACKCLMSRSYVFRKCIAFFKLLSLFHSFLLPFHLVSSFVSRQHDSVRLFIFILHGFPHLCIEWKNFLILFSPSSFFRVFPYFWEFFSFQIRFPSSN